MRALQTGGLPSQDRTARPKARVPSPAASPAKEKKKKGPSKPRQRQWIEKWFAPDFEAEDSYLRARWLYLRALGVVFFSAFYSLYYEFQIDSLIGPNGVLPADDYMKMAKAAWGIGAYWQIPSLLWLPLRGSSEALALIVWAGFAASCTLFFNLWPRMSLLIAMACFLSFVAAGREFTAYQADELLIEAAFLTLFFAPRGVDPGMGAADPPSRASLFMMRCLILRVFLESGIDQMLNAPQLWRNFSAMDAFYENLPLPTWIAWYIHHWPHAIHAYTTAAILLVEFFVIWMMFLGRLSRVLCFCVLTAVQIGTILTANNAFLNYLLLALGLVLLDDVVLRRKSTLETDRILMGRPAVLAAVLLPFQFLAAIVAFAVPSISPVGTLHIANRYALFSDVPRARYEIEFQATRDGSTWIPYPFRDKPQDVSRRPGLFAPYQPRFEWRLWSASHQSVAQNRWVLNAQVRLMQNDPSVMRLFAPNSFEVEPPRAVRVVVWRYWFASESQKRTMHVWWNRIYLGLYTPVTRRTSNGEIQFVMRGIPARQLR